MGHPSASAAATRYRNHRSKEEMSPAEIRAENKLTAAANKAASSIMLVPHLQLDLARVKQSLRETAPEGVSVEEFERKVYERIEIMYSAKDDHVTWFKSNVLGLK